MNQTIDDLGDEAFCKKMVQDHEHDPGKGSSMPIEEFAQQLGISSWRIKS